MAFSVTVTARDPYGNTATGYVGTVHFTSSDSQAILPADSTLASGIGTFSVTLKTAGNRTVTAADTADGSITGQATVTVSPVAANYFVVSGFPSPTTAGVAHHFTVTAKDPYGNTATGYSGTVHLTSSDPQAALPADYTFLSGDHGRYTFSATLKTAGTRSLTAIDTADGNITGTQANLRVTPAAASHLRLAALSRATLRVPFTVTVTALDPYGNRATGYRGRIHFTSSDPKAKLPADYTFTTADNGRHTFRNGITLRRAGRQTITATDRQHSSMTGTATVNVTSAPASPLPLFVAWSNIPTQSSLPARAWDRAEVSLSEARDLVFASLAGSDSGMEDLPRSTRPMRRARRVEDLTPRDFLDRGGGLLCGPVA
jgi:hypothetical protein